jgi:hypothetical protein
MEKQSLAKLELPPTHLDQVISILYIPCAAVLDMSETLEQTMNHAELRKFVFDTIMTRNCEPEELFI